MKKPDLTKYKTTSTLYLLILIIAAVALIFGWRCTSSSLSNRSADLHIRTLPSRCVKVSKTTTVYRISDVRWTKKASTLMFYSQHQTVVVEADGKLLYTRSLKPDSILHTTGRNCEMVSVPENTRSILVTLTNCNPDKQVSDPVFYQGDGVHMFRHELLKAGIPMLLGIMNVALGILMLTYWLFVHHWAYVSKSLLYLGITYSKNEVVQDVLDWFDEEIDFLNYGNPMQELRMAVSKSEDVKRLMLQMIQEMDLDIVDFRVEEKENDRIEVFTKHVVDEYEAELNLFDESSGTKKLFGLLPFIAKSLLRGTTLVIDELDAKIHPVLLKYLIMTFSNMEKNKKGAQLIFTSHDLSTMNSEVFRRDEIWFVAKGNRQNSKLYSLVEFKNKKGESVRKDAKFDKQYLEGKYGADPYLRKIIDWGTVNG